MLVNVPEFRLRVFRDGRKRDEARVIVGKPDSRTPLFSGLMEYAVVNPSWYVPPSILKTMLPKIASYGGSTWGGYEIVRRGGHVSLRQPPGEKNALGFIKFMFPNQHAVYLHDTPNRSLFSRSERALSHGCVRVDDPFRFADIVLPNWTEERLKKLVGKGERTIRLEHKLPVHLAYFTAYRGRCRQLPDPARPLRLRCADARGPGPRRRRRCGRQAAPAAPSEARGPSDAVAPAPRAKPRHAAVPHRAVARERRGTAARFRRARPLDAESCPGLAQLVVTLPPDASGEGAPPKGFRTARGPRASPPRQPSRHVRQHACRHDFATVET